jgi:hypothetical protein
VQSIAGTWKPPEMQQTALGRRHGAARQGDQSMNTAFILMAQYHGRAIIPLDQMCKDYFTHLTTEMFQRKVLAGHIKIPITRLEPSQKSAKGIHITDLVAYLELQRDAAVKEFNLLNGVRKVS